MQKDGGMRRAWLLVALLWVVALLNYLDRQVIFSVLPLLQAEMKLTGFEMGLLGTVFLWVYGILSPFAGYMGDRFGRGKVIFASLVVWSAVTYATGHARNLTELLIARGLMGISEACYIPAALALIADRHGERTRSLASGLHNSGIYLGVVIGGAGGGWMGQRFGWRFAFTLLGMFGVLYGLLLGWYLRRESSRGPKPAGQASLGRALGTLIRSSAFLAFAAVFSITSIANWIAYTWLPLYLYETFGMSLPKAGFTATFYIQAASFLGILLGGSLADRWISRNRRARLYTQALGLAAAAPFLFLVGWTASTPVLVASLVVFGLGRGVFDCNCMPVLCQIAEPRMRATGYGFFNFCGCVVGGLMAAVAGAMKASLGLNTAFQIAAGLLLLAAVMLWRLRLPAAPEEVEP